MNEQINSVDFWVDELTHDINPEHFNHHENFIPYMHDDKISSFGNWMWNNGYNVGLANLQAKVNTYCVPQWVSVKDRLPDDNEPVLVYTKDGAMFVCSLIVANAFADPMHSEVWEDNNGYYISDITHWAYLPETPESEDAE